MRLLAVVGILASVGCWRLAAQAFTLTGTVVDGASSRPLAGVDLSLQTEKWQVAGDPAISDAQGPFLFRGLAAGEYILSATASGYGNIQYGEAPDPGWVHSIHLGSDKSIVFPLTPRATIEGVVRDEFGDPMMNANVFVVRPLWNDGRTTLRTIANKTTDDRGHYRFGKLAPGSYIVCATGRQGMNAPAPARSPLRPSRCGCACAIWLRHRRERCLRRQCSSLRMHFKAPAKTSTAFRTCPKGRLPSAVFRRDATG
jgi:hypothetical protein